MFRQFGTGEILLVLLVLILLFGAKKLPDTARGLGRSLRILKAETKGLSDDARDDDRDDDRVAPREIERTTRPLDGDARSARVSDPERDVR